MPPFECTEEEIRFLKRKRALESAGMNRLVVGLKPLAILEKIDTRPELLERPLLTPPLSPQSNQV